MRVEIGDWTLEKAHNSPELSDKICPVRMLANRLDLDKENQEILPRAFSKATVDFFMKEGIIDWHHQSQWGKTQELRAQAILGKPIDFVWENNFPVVYGNLTKSHPIVSDSILPHLEAEQPVFGSSVGGSIRKARAVWDSAISKMKEQISEIYWDHIAIAARPYVMSAGAEVSLVKAMTGGDELFLRFNDVQSFEVDYINAALQGHQIVKALEVGAGTDSATLSGVDALRTQSLEGDMSSLVQAYFIALRSGDVAPTRKGAVYFLKAHGFNDSQAEAAVDKLMRALTDIF